MLSFVFYLSFFILSFCFHDVNRSEIANANDRRCRQIANNNLDKRFLNILEIFFFEGNILEIFQREMSCQFFSQ